jgi:Sec-independent protein translocase protein TatA
MAAQLYMPTLLLILGTVLIVFGMKYVSEALQARTRAANERSFRLLAEDAQATQTQQVALLSSIQSSVSDIGARLDQVERILREVG